MSNCGLFVGGILCLAVSAVAQLPNPQLTPGATVQATKAQICTKGYATAARHVSIATKRQVFREYGIPWSQHKHFEVDHLISLEIGGANTINNLWPESYSGALNAHTKDALEDRLHALVCSGQFDLGTAQQEIRTDWVAAYKKRFHTEAPIGARRVGSGGVRGAFK